MDKDIPPPLPPKLQLFLTRENQEETDASLLADSFYGSSKFLLKKKKKKRTRSGEFILIPYEIDELGNTKLRVLNIPQDIQTKFLKLARFNTKNNVETCGILSGKLVCALFKKKIFVNFLASILTFYLYTEK